MRGTEPVPRNDNRTSTQTQEATALTSGAHPAIVLTTAMDTDEEGDGTAASSADPNPPVVAYDPNMEPICGIEVNVRARLTRDGGQHVQEKRYWMVCQNAAHANCHKSRSSVMNVEELGITAPHDYLSTWQAKAFDLDRDKHFAWRPSLAEIQAWRARDIIY